MGGIKLQLLCGVRIELAVGSLPYPGESGFPIVSPRRNRPLSGFPICKPCLDMSKIPQGIPTFLPMEGVHAQNQNQKMSNQMDMVFGGFDRFCISK